MNISDTISVNPVKKTLGALHPDATVRFLRNRAMAASAISHKRILMNLTFACSTPGVKKFSGYMLLFRAMLAAILIVSGSFILYGEIYAPETIFPPHVYAIGEIVVGGMLALGLLTRFASACATAMFGLMAVESVMAGIFDIQSLTMCGVSLAFLIMGAGRFSCDFLIRKAIIKFASRRKRNIKAKRMTYRAFRYGQY